MSQEPRPDERPSRIDSISELMVRRARERREKIVAEIEANRRGDYKIPTWVLALALVALVGGFVVFLIFV
jgi:hypothetical protein